jgi:hypothetical protein
MNILFRLTYSNVDAQLLRLGANNSAKDFSIGFAVSRKLN